MIEYAEEYPKTEKYKRVFLFILLGGLCVIINEKWFLPFLNWYVDTVYCHQPFGYSGISVLWYSLFVGIPLLVVLLSIPYDFICIRAIRQQQFPPQGMKVYKPTKIRRGWQANAQALFFLLITFCFIVFSVWGYFEAGKMPQEVPEDFDYSVCES